MSDGVMLTFRGNRSTSASAVTVGLPSLEAVSTSITRVGGENGAVRSRRVACQMSAPWLGGRYEKKNSSSSSGDGIGDQSSLVELTPPASRTGGENGPHVHAASGLASPIGVKPTRPQAARPSIHARIVTRLLACAGGCRSARTRLDSRHGPRLLRRRRRRQGARAVPAPRRGRRTDR